ncbi:MAG: serine/threonine-protein kinase [Chloroflexota bacterium]
MIPFALLPITMLIAITKSRLWEIDLLLNKATVTTGVTLTLLVIGGVGVGVLQALISNTIIAIVTMLVVVIVLYKPVRRAVQSLLDRQILGLRFDLDQLQQVQLSREITNRGQHSGLKLANVELLNVIDRGGMGEVYQGIWHERAVAIKTMLKKLAKEPIARKRFEREIRAGQLLSHPHIVKTLDSGAFDDIPYLVLEYIAGHTLKNHSENTPLSTDEALKIVCEVGDALAYLHQQGMVHRDIKPSNIMLRDVGSSVLIDFGLVKFAEDDTDLTGKAAIGTIDYMAPEQIKSAGTVDQRADVYALGILLYELLTGQTPFAGDAGQILFAHLTQPPPDLSDFGLGIPEYVSNAVQRALMKDPDDRYPSVSAFMEAVALPLAA